jgi:ABC-type Fe3+-hydroxamate transport system substrate-binding protein
MGRTFEEMMEEMRFYGMVFQKEARAEAYNRYLQQTIDRIRARTANIPSFSNSAEPQQKDPEWHRTFPKRNLPDTPAPLMRMAC